MEQDPYVVLGSTVSDVSDLKKDIVNLGRVLSACDFQNVCGDVDGIKEMIKDGTTSCSTIFSDLKSIKSRLSDTSSAFSSYSEQLRTIFSDFEKFSELSKVTLAENSCLSSVKTDQDFCHLLSKLARGLQNGLFAHIRELSTFSLGDSLNKFIDQYNELNIKYNELLAMSSQIPVKQSSPTVLLDQTAVFEMLEREMSNSAKEVEHVRSSFESRLKSITADWECERSKLMTDLHKSEVRIEELQQSIEAKETAFSKFKGDLDELAQQFCSKENVPVGPNLSLDQLRSFLNRLEKKCPWIWDLFYDNSDAIPQSILPNPIEQKKSLDTVILERNELEEQWHQTRQELLTLKNSHVEMSSQLKAKNDELNEMFEKLSKLQQRVSHYRELVKKLCDPKMAAAFAENVRQNLSSNKIDIHGTTNTTTNNHNTSSLIQSTPLMMMMTTNSTSSTMHYDNLTPCIMQSDQENSLTAVSTLTTNKSSSSSSGKSFETSSTSSIFSRVGAAVTAIANIITSPKRLQQSPEYLSDNKRSRPAVPVTETIGVGKSEEKLVHYDSVHNKISHPVLSTKSNNFIIPDKPILSSSSSAATAITTTAHDTGSMRYHHSSTTRKPLTELSGSKVKSSPSQPPQSTTNKSDHNNNPSLYSPTPLWKKDCLDNNYSKPIITDSHNFHSKKLQPDYSFLQHGPLAESTTQLPQDLLRSVHANVGKDHLNVNHRPFEFNNRPPISQSRNKKDELFATPAAPKPFSPSWQIPKQEPMKQKSSSDLPTLNTPYTTTHSNEPNKISSRIDQRRQNEVITNTNTNSQKVQRHPSSSTSTAPVPSFHRKTSNITNAPPQDCNPS